MSSVSGDKSSLAKILLTLSHAFSSVVFSVCCAWVLWWLLGYYCSYFFLIQIINLLKWHCIKVWQQSMSGSPFMLDHTKMWLLFIGFWTLSAESMPIRLRHTNDDPVFCPLSYNIEVSSIFKISCPFLNNHTLIFSTSHSPPFFFHSLTYPPTHLTHSLVKQRK